MHAASGATSLKPPFAARRIGARQLSTRRAWGPGGKHTRAQHGEVAEEGTSEPQAEPPPAALGNLTPKKGFLKAPGSSWLTGSLVTPATRSVICLQSDFIFLACEKKSPSLPVPQEHRSKTESSLSGYLHEYAPVTTSHRAMK